MTGVAWRDGGTSQPESRPSRLGLGGWAFGRTGWGEQRDGDSRAAIGRAVQRGVNWIDTAAVYGDGHSERLIGEVVHGLPASERPSIFTKGGVRIDRSGATFRDLRPVSLRRECEESLRRLRLERIDLYQLHWPTEDRPAVEAAWDSLGDLQREGKIRLAGVSNFDIDLLSACERIRPIDAAQLRLSLLDRETGLDALPWAADHGVPVLVYSPLGSGLLTGRFSPERLRSLPPTDWRRARERFQERNLTHTRALLDRLRPIATRLGASLVELAIAWTLTWPAVRGTIIGARDAQQVEGWIRASELALDDSVLHEIETALTEAGAGAGPPHPNGRR